MKLLDQYGIEIDKNNPPSMVYPATKTIRICIHNYAGRGKKWFLSAPELRINNEELKTENFTEALENAKRYVGKRFLAIKADVEKFIL